MNEVRRKGKGPPSLRETGLVTCTREDGSGRVFQIGVIIDRAGVLALGRQIAVDELDDRHRRCVRCADARLDAQQIAERKSVGEGKRVSVRGDTGGRRIMKKKNIKKQK